MDIQRINRKIFAELGKEKQLVEYHKIMFKLLGIVVDFINADGESLKLSRMRRFNPFCAAIRATRSGFAACQDCDQRNARSASIARGPLVYRCHAGLTEIVLPLFDSAGGYIGCMTSGQFLIVGDRQLDDEEIAVIATRHQIAPNLLRERYQETRILSPSQVEGVIDYLKAVGLIITETHNKLLFLETIDTPDKISLIKRYARENYMRKLTVTGVAKKFYLSEGHFCRFFKKEVGVSFICFLNMCRIAKAEEMLTRTSRGIAEIAFLAGYGSVSQFNRVFKELKGVSARQFRNARHSSSETP